MPGSPAPRDKSSSYGWQEPTWTVPPAGARTGACFTPTPSRPGPRQSALQAPPRRSQLHLEDACTKQPATARIPRRTHGPAQHSRRLSGWLSARGRAQQDLVTSSSPEDSPGLLTAAWRRVRQDFVQRAAEQIDGERGRGRYERLETTLCTSRRFYFTPGLPQRLKPIVISANNAMEVRLKQQRAVIRPGWTVAALAVLMTQDSRLVDSRAAPKR